LIAQIFLLKVLCIKKKKMIKKTIIIAFLILAMMRLSYAQQKKTDANIFGHVICPACEEHISFATVLIEGTTIGTTTDETGHYQLINLKEGTYVLKAQLIGYKPQIKEVTVNAGQSIEVNFELEQDVLGLEELVVTANRNEINRREASSIVSTLTPKLFSSTQSVNLSEGLNYCTGLRMENNCQNCGFTQLRMNGMEGPYSQVLINSRPIFSGLAGVYGLELIPANMIERVEVIRGGGSALYGSNAIAGTVNLILKDPINNSYVFGMNSGLIGLGLQDAGESAMDNAVNFNTSLVSSDSKSGMSLFGFYRNRDAFDANDDGFSEISTLNNITVGSRIYHRFSTKDKLVADFFTINEDRRGGDRIDYPLHQANIAEAVTHNINTAALTYEHYFRDKDIFSVYASGQRINRDSYYGAEQSLSDYGNTKDLSYATGIQYSANFKKSELLLGLENTGSWLKDTKLGYPDLDSIIILNDSTVEIPSRENTLVADQSIITTAVFSQYEFSIAKFKFSVGARLDNYTVSNKQNEDATISGTVLSPRLSMKYDVKKYLQARISYAQGYRAPQIFDEDLHIETSGSRQVIHQNSTDLKQENSASYMASLDFNKKLGKINLSFLVEGFYTKLENPFANEYSEPDESGKVIYTRINAEKGAIVQGFNLELVIAPSAELILKTGFTIQSSEYEEAVEFDETCFFRTPSQYGFMNFDWKINKKWNFSSSLNYTGKMLVPYFGTELAVPEDGELRESNPFYDAGAKISYTVKLNGAKLQLFAGMKNIFNSYQNDFDYGIERDPGYMYGPMQPRTIYFGLRFGNLIQ
jgi:outer membrane receptor for ferrienterochelin and colicins